MDPGRKFNDALNLSPKKAGRSKQALSYIQKLYGIEKRLKDKPSPEKYTVRQKESIPILNAFKVWLDRLR